MSYKPDRHTNWQKQRKADKDETIMTLFHLVVAFALAALLIGNFIADQKLDQIDRDIEYMQQVVEQWEASE